MNLVKDIAAVVGLVLSSISLLTVICKPLRNVIINFVTHQSGKTELQQQIEVIRRMLEEHLETDKQKQVQAALDQEALLCILRNSITKIYYDYLPHKQIPAHEYKNMIFLAEAYIKLGGNSYVSTIVENMKDWDVLPD